MRAVTAVTIALSCGLIGGCMRPAKLNIMVSPVVPGEVSIKPAAGSDHDPTANVCALPCAVDIPFPSTYEFTIRAPGYFPATLEISWEAAAGYNQSHPEGTLVVPLQECGR